MTVVCVQIEKNIARSPLSYILTETQNVFNKLEHFGGLRDR